MNPRSTLMRFDALLAREQLPLDAVVLGGAALVLLGVVSRATRDVDILHPSLSAEIRAAAETLAKQVRAEGESLDDDWLNDAAASVGPLLPEGWLDRTEVVFQGEAIRLRSLGRLDLLRTKLFALCDRNIDLGDCVALSPSGAELDLVLPWLTLQDANPDWPAYARSVIDDLRVRLRHGA